MSSIPEIGDLKTGGHGSPAQREIYPFIPPLHADLIKLRTRVDKEFQLITCLKTQPQEDFVSPTFATTNLSINTIMKAVTHTKKRKN